jgi:hypothetical protein
VPGRDLVRARRARRAARRPVHLAGAGGGAGVAWADRFRCGSPAGPIPEMPDGTSRAASRWAGTGGSTTGPRARGLLALYLFSDVDAASAPTRVRPGSHRDAARVLAPAGDEGMPFPQAARLAARASAARPTELATGQAGDVIVCHPFLVHAASWPHTGRHPRIMAQPGVALHDAFPLVPPLSPVELAMRPEQAA